MAASTMPSPAELDQLAVVDPDIDASIKAIPALAPPKEIPDPVKYIQATRVAMSTLQDGSPDADVSETDSTYQTRDGATLRLHISQSTQKSSKPSPLLVWYYGGGFCLGMPEINRPLFRTLVKTYNMTIIAPQYRLAPEHKLPTGVNDAWDAFKHIASNISSYSAHPETGFLVGGESAGAVISALVALQARDNAITPPLTGQYLSAGSYINPDGVPSPYQSHYRSRQDERCRIAPFLSWVTKQAFDVCAEPDYTSPYYRASIWPTGLGGLPKAYFQACGVDINRDDSFIYRDMLVQSGVETKLDVYAGAPHCFWILMKEVAAAGKWRTDMLEGFRWLLDNGGR